MATPGANALLTDRALNRATLHRQLLLRRAQLSASDAVERLVCLQAQTTNAPYITLFTRLEAFAHHDLIALLHDRQVVRCWALRGTLHLLSAADFIWMRPLLQPVLDRVRQAGFGRRTAGIDLAELATVGRDLLRGRVLTRPQLRDLLARRWPDRDAEALAWSLQALLPILHPPPSGIWRTSGPTPVVLADNWLGQPIATTRHPDNLICRYLTAFGPASIADIQAWSGLTRLREVVERLRPHLRTFRHDSGADLYDLPDAPLPDPDTPSVPRLLPEFDNLIVAYANRTRLMTDEHRKRICVGALVAPTILIDGTIAGTWKVDRGPDTTTLHIQPFHSIAPTQRTMLIEEGNRLLTFAAPHSGDHHIHIDG